MNFSAILNRLALAEVTLAGAQPGMADAAAAVVAARLRITDRDGAAVVQVVDDHGTVRIGNTRGDDLDVAAYVRELAKKRPVFFRPAPEASTTTTTQGAAPVTLDATTSDMVRAAREGAARDARAAELERAGWPNPWKAGAENLSRQMALMNLDPARAARFQAEAGAR